MRRLENEWNMYNRAVNVPAGATEVQVWETRRAFYAGAQALFTVLTGQVSGGHPDTVTPGDIRLMEEVAAELREHVALVKAGQR